MEHLVLRKGSIGIAKLAEMLAPQGRNLLASLISFPIFFSVNVAFAHAQASQLLIESLLLTKPNIDTVLPATSPS